jgi:hypothetical protein
VLTFGDKEPSMKYIPRSLVCPIIELYKHYKYNEIIACLHLARSVCCAATLFQTQNVINKLTLSVGWLQIMSIALFYYITFQFQNEIINLILHGSETLSLILKDYHPRLGVFENWVLSKTFGRKKQKSAIDCRKNCVTRSYKLCTHHKIILQQID